MSDEMEEIIAEFITEAEESLDKIEPMFVALEQAGADPDMLNEIFRSVHTIKGAAGFLGYQPIVDVSHYSESIMKRLRDGDISMSKPMMDGILKAVDMIRLLLGHLKEADGIEEDVAPLVKELDGILNDAIAASSGTPPEISTGEPVNAAEDFHMSDVMEEAAGAEISNEAVQAITEENNETAETITENHEEVHEEDVINTAAVQEKTPESSAAPKKIKETAHNLRVDVERIDKVMDLAGEVVLVRNRLLNISNLFNQKYGSDTLTDTLSETVSFLDRITSDMQVAVMKIRMQPIKKVLGKFPRLVRDISASVDKDVELEVYGEGTEVDKTVIENIGDPLTHILRNSIDHGIESPEERIAKGKNPKGKVVINIYQKGNQIVIEITDDGKGIDVDKLRQKAVEKGLFTEDEAAKISDEAATDIIFMPGFSTVEVATELSGRGVGMDVVKTNISLLNGYVEVSTVKDVGSTFKISIPLTLAIIQALMVEASGNKYAIPLTPIEETLKVSMNDIDNVTGQNVIVIRDKVCPLFELTDMLGIGGYKPADEAEATHKYIVVISIGDKKFCIAVDRLLGQEEVVIKSIDGMDTASSYVLGATITGDGKVVFILDVTGISRNLLEITK